MDRYRTTSLLKYNLKDFLNKELVNQGLYLTISSGFYDVYGNRADTLRRVNGTLYESAFDKWVVEADASGIAPYNTVVCSGVTIDGVFHAKGAAPYSPVVDYDGGRVFFGSNVPAASTVEAVFSYKQVCVDFPDSNKINLLFSQIKDNTDLTTYAYPSGNQRQVPAVVVDVQRENQQPFALGGYRQSNYTVVFHILANNDDELDLITDILRDKYRTVISGIDYNKTPEQYTYQGDRASTYQSYTDLQGDSTYAWTRIYIDNVTKRETDVFYNMRRGRVDWTIRLVLSR